MLLLKSLKRREEHRSELLDANQCKMQTEWDPGFQDATISRHPTCHSRRLWGDAEEQSSHRESLKSWISTKHTVKDP